MTIQVSSGIESLDCSSGIPWKRSSPTMAHSDWPNLRKHSDSLALPNWKHLIPKKQVIYLICLLGSVRLFAIRPSTCAVEKTTGISQFAHLNRPIRLKSAFGTYRLTGDQGPSFCSSSVRLHLLATGVPGGVRSF